MPRMIVYTLLVLALMVSTVLSLSSGVSGVALAGEMPHREKPTEPEPEDLIHPAQSDDPIAAAGQAKIEHYKHFDDKDWKAILSDKEFYILRQSGTEYPGTGRYLDSEKVGAYHCAGCSLKLYNSQHKFHSGCGWPSFNQEVEEGALTYYVDESVGMVRKEMRCARCDGHMGHVFQDAPDQPTGLRHCVNGYAIVFIPAGQKAEEALVEHRRMQTKAGKTDS